jgi:hypothetical protein
MSTGFSDADARSDYDRERRRRALAKILARLRFEPDDVSHMLPFEEVVAALGRTGEHDAGIQSIPLDSIVGTVDRRSGSFDRAFRPTGTELRARWLRVAAARRRGEPMPPIDVYRIGELHFVRDGHHRVSVARAAGDAEIQAHVRVVRTKLGADLDLLERQLPLKAHERMFHERVPLPPPARARIQLSDEWRYAQLANLIESWGYRASHARGHLLSREDMAAAWFAEEYEPVAEVLRDESFGGEGTETERYLRIAMLRFLLLGTHDWSDDVARRLLGELRSPDTAREDDTMVHMLLKEMR